LADLVAVMARLLAPDGCPWDREQTLASLRPFLLEETYEVLDALESGTPAEHCEELGDLLMQIVFQAALREAQEDFDIDDVVRGIAEKLRRRHPHVFGGADRPHLTGSEEVLAQWETIKATEKPRAENANARLLDGIPTAIPALARAQKVSERVARVGFDWPDVTGCRAKVSEELAELDREIAVADPARLEAELGDLLFAVVSLARKLGCDAESALRTATTRFSRRFAWVEEELARRGKSPADSNLEEMDAIWTAAKEKEHSDPGYGGLHSR
jgi:MazG family protein